MKRSMIVAYTFVLMNWAAVLGLYHFVRGNRDIWHRSAGGRQIRNNSQAGA
jgi:hypothetical protein